MENEVGMEDIEKLSRVVSMSVFDVFSDTDKIFPAYFIAGLMSDKIWSDNLKKNLYPFKPTGELKTLNKRTNDLQVYMNNYEFTTMDDYPGGDPWGLVAFEDEKKRLGSEFIESIKKDIELSLKHIAKHNPENQFAKILREPFYKNDYYPRYRNEIIEIMNKYRHIRDDGKGSGKCIALIMAAMSTAIAYFKIPIENICIIGSRGHVLAFIELDNGKYCIWNNRLRYANNTIDKFKTDIIPKLDGVKQDYFFYPAYGICNFENGVSNVSKDRVLSTIKQLEQFVGIKIKDQENKQIQWIEDTSNHIPNPVDFENANEYRKKICDLAQKIPFSIYDYARYAYRNIDVPYPQAYIVAAKRDYYTAKKAENIKTFENAFDEMRKISSHDSIFGNRERIALPDEVLLFKNGNDRDRALLLYCLLSNLMNASTSKSFIGFSSNGSFVKCHDFWINASDLTLSKEEPSALKIIFNENESKLL